MKTRRTPRGARAFTLIEILAVIAVIAVLAAILIPVVSGARNQANLSKSVAQLREIGNAVSLYAQNHGGTLPTPSNMVQQDNPNRTHWALEIGRGGLLGPAETFIHQTLIAPNPGYEDPSGGLRGRENTYLTYSMTGAATALGSGGSLDFTAPRKRTQIENPADTALVFLARQRAAKDGYARTVHPNFSEIERDVQANNAEATDVLNFAYNNTMPMLMADGSVRALDFSERDFLTRERWEGRRID